MKAIEKLLTSGISTGAMIKSLEKIIELNRIRAEFSLTIETIKDLLNTFQDETNKHLDKIIERLSK